MTSQAAAVYFDPPPLPRAPLWRRWAFFILIAGLHVVALLIAFSIVMHEDEPAPPPPLTVRVLEVEPPRLPPPAPKAEPPKTAPMVPAPPRKIVQAPPPPVLTAAPTAPAEPSFAVAPQPEPRPVEAPPAPPAPPVIVPARFDADYLHNPKPDYPDMSTRLNEQGRVELRVRVSAQGLPLSVDIAKSSGYPRLDRAARAAVEKYRFVPARQGNEPIESSIIVPMTFKLD